MQRSSRAGPHVSIAEMVEPSPSPFPHVSMFRIGSLISPELMNQAGLPGR